LTSRQFPGPGQGGGVGDGAELGAGCRDHGQIDRQHDPPALPGRGVTVRVPISRAGRRAIQRAPLPATARLVGTTGAQTVRVARAVTLVAPPARPR